MKKTLKDISEHTITPAQISQLPYHQLLEETCRAIKEAAQKALQK